MSRYHSLLQILIPEAAEVVAEAAEVAPPQAESPAIQNAAMLAVIKRCFIYNYPLSCYVDLAHFYNFIFIHIR